MGSQEVFLGLFSVPLVVISFASIATLLVNLLDCIHVLLVLDSRFLGLGDEESIMCVSGGMRLRLEQCIEIPER